VDGKMIVGTPRSHQSRSVPVPRFLRDDLAVQLAGRAPGDLVFSGSTGTHLRGRTGDAVASIVLPIR